MFFLDLSLSIYVISTFLKSGSNNCSLDVLFKKGSYKKEFNLNGYLQENSVLSFIKAVYVRKIGFYFMSD